MDLGPAPLQSFDFEGLIRKIFRNKELEDADFQLSNLSKSFDMVLSFMVGRGWELSQMI
jgi:hypothetical protein